MTVLRRNRCQDRHITAARSTFRGDHNHAFTLFLVYLYFRCPSHSSPHRVCPPAGCSGQWRAQRQAGEQGPGAGGRWGVGRAGGRAGWTYSDDRRTASPLITARGCPAAWSKPRHAPRPVPSSHAPLTAPPPPSTPPPARRSVAYITPAPPFYGAWAAVVHTSLG